MQIQSVELQSVSRCCKDVYLVNAYNDKQIIKVELNKPMTLTLLAASSGEYMK